jgi:hypothetical protein
MNLASDGTSSVLTDTRPRRASAAAIVDFPAAEQPAIWIALIGAYRSDQVLF